MAERKPLSPKTPTAPTHQQLSQTSPSSSPPTLPPSRASGTNRSSTTSLPPRTAGSSSSPPRLRDLSFRQDRPGHGRSFKKGEFFHNRVPPTLIPEEDHIKVKSATPPIESNLYSSTRLKTEYSEEEKVWQTTVFPSLIPAGRQEVVMLERWLNEKLADNYRKHVDPLEAVKEAQEIYSIAFHELCRQVYVHCAERGELMEKVWSRYLQLFDQMLKIREKERELYAQKLQQQKELYEEYYKQKDSQFSRLYLAMAADKEKAQMAKDKLEQAVLVMQENFKNKLRKAVELKKTLKKWRTRARDTHKPEDGKPREEVTTAPSSSSTNANVDESDSDSEDDESQDILPSNVNINNFTDTNLVVISKLAELNERIKKLSRKIRKHSEKLANSETVQQLDHFVLTLSATLKAITVRNTNGNASGGGFALVPLDAAASEPNRNTNATNTQPANGSPTNLISLHPFVKKVTRSTQTYDIQVYDDDLQTRLIPTPFKPLFARSFKTPIVRIKTKQWVLDAIPQLYASKIAADSQHSACQQTSRPSSLAVHVYDFFLSLYGVREWAEMHLLDLLVSMRKFASDHTRIRMCARFCGAVPEEYDPDDLSFFLHTLAVIAHSLHERALSHSAASTPPAIDKPSPRTLSALFTAEHGETALIPVDIAFAAIGRMFGGDQSQASSVQRLSELVHTLVERNDTLDLDGFLELIVEEFHSRARYREERITAALFSNFAGDSPVDTVAAAEPTTTDRPISAGDSSSSSTRQTNAAAIASFSEFEAVMPRVNKVGKELLPFEMIALFREMLVRAEAQAIDPKTLITIARQHQLITKLPSLMSTSTPYEPLSLPPADVVDISFKFLDSLWAFSEASISERFRTLQGGLLVPRTFQRLQERLAVFRRHLAKKDNPTAAFAAFRYFMEELYFALKKQHRIIVGGAAESQSDMGARNPARADEGGDTPTDSANTNEMASAVPQPMAANSRPTTASSGHMSTPGSRPTTSGSSVRGGRSGLSSRVQSGRTSALYPQPPDAELSIDSLFKIAKGGDEAVRHVAEQSLRSDDGMAHVKNLVDVQIRKKLEEQEERESDVPSGMSVESTSTAMVDKGDMPA